MPNIPGVRRIPVAAAVAAAVLAGCSSSHNHAATTPTNGASTISVSVSRCGTGWTHPTVGHQNFRIHNTDTRGGEVFLVDAKTGAVFGFVEPLGAGTTAGLSVDLT